MAGRDKLYYDGKEVANDAITSFSGIYFYLSNFSRYYTPYDKIVYGSSEAAFQAQKTLDKSERYSKFTDVEPGIAKKLGRQVKLRPDWEEVKDDLMYEIVKSKFDNNPEIKRLLVDTGNRELYEGNYWNDKYWGVVTEGDKLVGKNKLGKILMKVREEYLAE